MKSFAPAATGIFCALGAAALFGASTPLAKALIGGVSPWLLAGLLYLGAGMGLAASRLSAVISGKRSEAPLRWHNLGWLAVIVLCGGIAGPVLLMLGLTVTDAATAALLLNLEGLATLAIAWMVYRENIDLRIGIGAAAILLGAGVLSWQGTIGLGFGTLAIAAACLCWGIDNNLTRKLSGADPLTLAMIKGLAAGAINILLAAAQGAAWPSWTAIASAMLVGFAGYGLSLVLFIYALRQLGAARTGAYFSLAPFIGAAVAIVGFAEPLSLRLVAAGLLMALGLYLHLIERHEHEHSHGEQAHEHAHRHDAHHQHTHAPTDPPGEPHAHWHRHALLIHRHLHYPDIHHRHGH